MKGIILIVSILTVFANSFGQVKFFKTYSDNGFDFGQGIVQLQDSSYLVTGTSSSFVNAPSELFLMKLNKFGGHVWAKHYGGDEADWGSKVLNWNDSIFFIAGHTQTLGENGFDLFLVKVDKYGNLIRENTIGTSGWDRVNDALITPDSSVVMVGETTDTPTSNSNFYIVKTDHNGDTLWTRNFGSNGFDILNSVVQQDATTFFAAGAYYNADSSLYKGAIVKFNDLGDVEWIKQYGANGEYQLFDIYLKSGKICGVGTRRHPIEGDQDEWQLRINDDGTPWLMDFEQHKPGEIVFVGATLYGDDSKSYVVWEFNDELSANNSFDVAYIRYENNLDYEWFNPNIPAVSVSFTMDDKHGEIIRTSDGGWVAVGTSPSEEFGGSTVYIMKTGPNDDFPNVTLSNSGSLVELNSQEKDEFSIFPNPASDYIVIQDNAFHYSSLIVRDLNGRIVEGRNTVNGQLILKTSNWMNGMYFLEFKKEDGEVIIKKILIQH